MRKLLAVAAFAAVSCCSTPGVPDAAEMLLNRIYHLEVRVEHIETEMALMKVKPKEEARVIWSIGRSDTFVGPPKTPALYSPQPYTYQNGCNTCTCDGSGGCTCTTLSCVNNGVIQ